MIYASTPDIKNSYNNKENTINYNKSEINININNILNKQNNNNNIVDSTSMQIINPFDSIASKKHRFQSLSNNNSNRVNNNRYSQVSNSISLSNSQTNKEKINTNDYNGRYKQNNNTITISHSLGSNGTNQDMTNPYLNNNSRQDNSMTNESNDIKFEIINNEEANNYKNTNNVYNSNSSVFSGINNNNIIKKNEEFNAIKESDEEDYNETNQEFLRALNLNDLESYVNKYKSTNIDKNYNTNNNYEINKRLSDIINNSPFDNFNFTINNKTGEINMDTLLTVSNIVFIKSLNNEQITEKFNTEFYEQILSARRFSNINADLHESSNFDSSLISVGQLHTYNGKNEHLFGRKTRDIMINDGNSFLKAFIFNYFENIIVNVYLDNIIFIIYIISTKLPLLNINDINIQEVLTILKIIFTHLQKKNITEAYIVLVNAFKENSNFEKGLIYFVKYCLKQFITDNYVLFNIDYLNEIIPTKYINNLNNQFDYQNYIQEKIMIDQDEIQYQILIFYLLPLIFQINLIIYTNSNSKNNKIIFKRKGNDNKKDIINIELNIQFGNTSILYTDAYYEQFKNIIPYINDFNYPVDKIQKLDNSNNILCGECFTYPENYIQIGHKIKPLCEKCFINAIKKVIDKRYILLKEDLFFHEEFYCSKIKLTNALENNLYLSLNDIKILLPNHNGIEDEIHKKIIENKKCDICNRAFKLSKYSVCLHPCGHIICDKCFIKCIYDLTHKRIILNKFEIKTEIIEYICPNPSCSNNRVKNLNNFIYKYFDNVEEYIKKANERFESQLQNFCCLCKKVSNKFIFDFEKNNNNNKKNLKHSICVECKKKLDFQKKRNYQTRFMCIFCDEYHMYNSLILDKKRDKEKNESCCAIF